MAEIRKIVLDVLKPHDPDISQLAVKLAGLGGVDGTNISVYEMDKEVENIKITIEGSSLNLEKIKEVISRASGTVHSIDEVVAGKVIVEEEETLHERT
jgi:hypothetical protein